MRLKLHGCPVYFYGEQEVRELTGRTTGWGDIRLERLSRDFLVNVHSG